MAATGKAVMMRRLGAAGFVFFFVKGLVWLGLGAAAVLGFSGGR